ncbi:GNAT family N-acetyltransferase [Methanosarcina sp. UBA5]|uniref:GNAT family N-acetyltransferase n=1 Tax=Methanosarcina sp. UBA5 TaxID=1915593 RepID=UPI0025D0842B|nr:N-acetyltransferase [Methanosarcina sp. UBA5]
MQLKYSVRGAELSDLYKIMVLYRAIAARSGGIARQADEITEAHVRNFIERCHEKGIILVIEDPSNPETLIAEVHTCSPGIRVFSHLFSDLTIAVHPDYQGKGIGSLLFRTLLQEIESKHPEIIRVELVAKESNQKAIRFYKKFGFRAEGRLEKRISGKTGELEADIPMAWVRQEQGPPF